MERWFYSDGMDSVGPFEYGRLVAMHRAGLITDQSLIWREGLDRWYTFSEVAQPAPVVPPPLPVSPVAPSPTRVRPGLAWRRLGARMFDTFVHSSIGWAVVFFFLYWMIPRQADDLVAELGSNPGTRLIEVVIGTFFAAFVGGPIVGLTGGSLGKLIFGIRVQRSDGLPIGAMNGLKRELVIWIKGLAMGLPFVAAVTQAMAYRRLTQTGAASWDDGRYEVTYRPGGGKQIALNVLGAVLCLVAVLATYVPHN